MIKELKVDVLNSTYDKELSKMFAEPRFLAIPKDRRKQLFDEYVKSIDLD